MKKTKQIQALKIDKEKPIAVFVVTSDPFFFH